MYLSYWIILILKMIGKMILPLERSITYTLSFTAKSYIYGPYTKADVIRKSRVIETIGDLNVNKRHVELNYTPKAKVDYNQDGQVDAADDAFVTAEDDFGFNEGMNFLWVA